MFVPSPLAFFVEKIVQIPPNSSTDDGDLRTNISGPFLRIGTMGKLFKCKPFPEFSFYTKISGSNICKATRKRKVQINVQSPETVDFILLLYWTCLFFKTKCDTTKGSGIHSHETRGRENYPTVSHRTVGSS